LATQVCDRWHILKNLGEAVEGFLIRTRLRLPDAKTAEPTPERPLTSYSATPAGQGKSQARLEYGNDSSKIGPFDIIYHIYRNSSQLGCEW